MKIKFDQPMTLVDLSLDVIEIHIKSINTDKEYTFNVSYAWIDSQTIGFEFSELDSIVGNEHENLTFSFT